MARTIAICLVIISTSAIAGGRGGHNTTFDPNWFGGPSNVVCLVASIAGKCTTGFGATCDGIHSDEAALQAYRTAAVAANPARSVLYMANPGSKCVFSGDDAITKGVKNADVWGYGVTVSNMSFGSAAPYSTSGGSEALLQSFNPGDQSVTLVSAGDAAIFSVGSWVSAGCIALQLGGDPPNLQRFNYRLITNISGSIITLNSPLDITCKSTYPLTTSAGQKRGPAVLYLLDSSWDTNVSYHGITVADPGVAYQLQQQGRTVILYDVTLLGTSSLGPTGGDNMWSFNTDVRTVEQDKVINNYSFVGGRVRQTYANQSASTNNLLLQSSSINSCGGTATNTIIRNTVCGYNPPAGGIAVGPQGFGHGISITIDGSVTNNSDSGSNVEQIEIPVTDVTFSSGTFVWSKMTPTDDFYRFFVPGGKYSFAWHNSFGSACTPLTTFTVPDIREDVNNLYADTDIGGSLPTPDCSGKGSTFAAYVAYPAATIIQKFSGPADLTQFAAPP